MQISKKKCKSLFVCLLVFFFIKFGFIFLFLLTILNSFCTVYIRLILVLSLSLDNKKVSWRHRNVVLIFFRLFLF